MAKMPKREIFLRGIGYKCHRLSPGSTSAKACPGKAKVKILIELLFPTSGDGECLSNDFQGLEA